MYESKRIVKQEDPQFLFFVDLLIYRFGPVGAQTVSLVDRIISKSAELWHVGKPLITLKMGAFHSTRELAKQASEFVSMFYGVTIPENSLELDYDRVYDYLKTYARSSEVKNYFDL